MARERPTTSTSPLSSTAFDREEAKPSQQVVVASYGTVLEAELARGRLEVEGIDAHLRDNHTVGVAAHLAVAVGGVKVTVDVNDLELARAALTVPTLVDEDDSAIDEPAAPETPVNAASDLARRAQQAAVFGVLVPPLGAIYSFTLVARAVKDAETLSSTARRQLSVAIVVDTFVIAATSFLVAWAR